MSRSQREPRSLRTTYIAHPFARKAIAQRRVVVPAACATVVSHDENALAQVEPADAAQHPGNGPNASERLKVEAIQVVVSEERLRSLLSRAIGTAAGVDGRSHPPRVAAIGHPGAGIGRNLLLGAFFEQPSTLIFVGRTLWLMRGGRHCE